MNKLLRKLALFPHVLRTWSRLRQVPNLYSLPDALMNWRQIFLPLRFTDSASAKAMARETQSSKVREGLYEVVLLGRDLVFYWPGNVDNNTYYGIEKEFDPRAPHCYTTPPIQLGPESLVIDVGACEGLFAFRVLKHNLAKAVICFEPFKSAADCIHLGAQKNKMLERIKVEPVGVGKISGWAKILESSTPDGMSIEMQAGPPNDQAIEVVSLDDYCAKNSITLTSRDLIKIDAEGSDFDVLLGAERLIRSCRPQIAVTTYHKEEHALQIATWLRQTQPQYQLRLKGLSFWTPKPNPVLLQASILPPSTGS